jgi:hypothetical protein
MAMMGRELPEKVVKRACHSSLPSVLPSSRALRYRTDLAIPIKLEELLRSAAILTRTSTCGFLALSASK